MVDGGEGLVRLDRWRDQPTYVEVWTEKASHVELMRQATSDLYVPIQMCRGYGSRPCLHDAAERFIAEDRPGLILYAGDHDASGLDIDRDIKDRLNFYNAPDVEVRRVALTIEQVRQHNLSPERLNPKDKRADAYRALYGDETWELDALDPVELQRLVREAVEECIDSDAWKVTEAGEEEEKKGLRVIAEHYDVALEAAQQAEDDDAP